MRRKTVLVLSLLGVLAMVASSEARLRIVVDPWWPRAIVIGPPPPLAPLPPPLAVAHGYVDLNVRPADADVTVDGAYRGKAYEFSRAPDFMTLVPGPHTIALSKDGFKTARFTIHVLAGKTIELDVRMDHLVPSKIEKVEHEPTYQLDLNRTGYLAVQVEPIDAAIYIDDVFYGLVSQFSGSESSIVLRAGKHKIEITRPGFKPFTDTIEIADDKVKEIRAKLDKN